MTWYQIVFLFLAIVEVVNLTRAIGAYIACPEDRSALKLMNEISPAMVAFWIVLTVAAFTGTRC